MDMFNLIDELRCRRWLHLIIALDCNRILGGRRGRCRIASSEFIKNSTIAGGYPKSPRTAKSHRQPHLGKDGGTKGGRL
jgi:hypothetical protein